MMRKNAQDDLDIGQIAEAELERLERQYRIMEGDRNAFCEDIYRSLREQRKTIAYLTKERSNLQLNFSVIKNPTNEEKDRHTATELNKLLKRRNQYDLDFKIRNTQVAELKQRVRGVERELDALRRKEVTEAQSQSQAAEYKQTVGTLENRLNVVSVKYNSMLAVNTCQREELDHLLQERAHFNNLYQRLVARLGAGKKTLVDLIEQATIAYDQREEAQVRLRAVKERGVQDRMLHAQDMREMMRRLDYDAKLQDFLGIKGQKRTMADLEAKEAANKLAQREATEALIAEYQSILSKIKQFSGEEQIDRLAAQFVKQEEENFALFNYVSELNNELEVVQGQVEEVQSTISAQRVVNAERARQQHDSLHHLRDRLQASTALAGRARDTLGAAHVVLDSLLAGVQELFVSLRCDSVPVLDLLGSDTQVTAFNVLLYLGVLERRVKDISKLATHSAKHAELPSMLSRLRLTQLGSRLRDPS